MKNTKSDAPNIPHRIYYYCPFLPLVSSRRLRKPPDYTFFLDEQPSVSRTTPLNFRSPFTTSTTFVVALPPHSIYHFSSRSLHAVLPVDPWISPEPSFPMDRYKPTTNHPRERSLFFLTPLWTPFQIQFLFVYPALPVQLSPDQPEIRSSEEMYFDVILLRSFPILSCLSSSFLLLPLPPVISSTNSRTTPRPGNCNALLSKLRM